MKCLPVCLFLVAAKRHVKIYFFILKYQMRNNKNHYKVLCKAIKPFLPKKKKTTTNNSMAFHKVLSSYNRMLLTLCRSSVWIGMKVLGANSIILITRKLWQMFPIKQELNITAAFFITKMFKCLKPVNFFDSPLRCLFAHQACFTLVKNIKNWWNWKFLII